MKDISIQRMNYFLTAAECGSFSAAAEKLFVSQPQISKWLRGLEEDLGIRLFQRCAHGVVLTREGRYLYEQWKPLYQSFNKTLTEIENMASKSRSTLNIGCYPVLGSSDIFASALNAFEKDWPATDISVEVYDFSDLRQKLAEGLLDMVFTYNFNLHGLSGITTTYLAPAQVCIALPSSHPLAKEKHLNPSALCGETLLLEQSPQDGRQEDNWVLDECKKNGCIPGHIRYVSNISSLMSAIHRGKGFSLICRDIADDFGKGIATFPLGDGYIPVYTVLAWRESHETPEIAAFSRQMKAQESSPPLSSGYYVTKM